jgi:polyhydroxyalkanoate synthesis repressor PhaR
MNTPTQHGTLKTPQLGVPAVPGSTGGQRASDPLSVPSLEALASASSAPGVEPPQHRHTRATLGVAPDVRIIKRYSNRKLYDTQSSRYVTLPQIADMVRSGSNLRIVDNTTGEDKTEVTFALIISEELRLSPRGIPLNTLTALIAHPGLESKPPQPGANGEQYMDSKTDPQAGEAQYSELRTKFERWFDQMSREQPAKAETLGALEAQLRRLDDRLTLLEKHLNGKEDSRE